MAIKDQLMKLKNNWLLIVILLVVVVFISNSGNLISLGATSYQGVPMMAKSYVGDYAVESLGMPAPDYDGFAPEIEARVLTKTSRLATEVERGTFSETESKVKEIIELSDAFLLNEDVYNYGTKRKSYYQGTYQIKVDVNKYSFVISQLKELGEIISFNENVKDITEQYTDLKVEIEVEKSRLVRYEEMYLSAKDVSDKIELNDRIFNQERKIKYMEESLENLDNKVDYSTIYLTVTEKQSEYIDVVFMKFSELVRSLVNSLNTLINLFFVLLPWALVAFIVFFIVKKVKR